jgi:error-prone DNA polymerase
MGMNYAKGLRQTSAEALVAARGEGLFASVDDLTRRVPVLNRKELIALAQIGALNALGEVEHRRDALWQVEWAGRPAGPLLRASGVGRGDTVAPTGDAAETRGTAAMPLKKMTSEERLAADYSGMGLTTGPHPMAYHRAALRADGIFSAEELSEQRSGRLVSIAGCVIARQRPGTAKGFVFLSVEDETGIANVILTPDVFERDRLVVTRSRFLRIEGPVQNQEGVIHVKAQRIEPLEITSADVRSRDFH